jgi:hypothetical protein
LPRDRGIHRAGSAAKSQAPPDWVVYEALCDPFPKYRQWFDLQADEVAPTILEHDRPHRVVWTSIWAGRPELRIEFEIDGGASGCNVTWTLLRSRHARPR